MYFKSAEPLNEAIDKVDQSTESYAEHYNDLHKILPNLKVIGGCCGTDHSHMEAVCKRIFIMDS